MPKGKLNAGLRKYLAAHAKHKKGKGFIGDIWKGIKDVFRESPGEESKFTKYAKRGKKLLDTAAELTGHEGLKKFSKKASDIADTVGSYGKRGVETAEDLGFGRKRKRKTHRKRRGGMINPIASPGPILSMGYGSSGEHHRKTHHRHRGGLSSKLVQL